MTGVLEWLLDLDNIRLARDAPLLLRWDRHAPAWLVFTIAVAGFAFVVMVYRREKTGFLRRFVLASVRCGLLAVALIAFCKPSLILQRNRVEPSYVALLVDTSASMGIQDADWEEPADSSQVDGGPGADSPHARRDPSRLDVLKAALVRDNGEPLRRLLENNGVQLAAFSGAVETLAFVESAPSSPVLVEMLTQLRPDGFSTDLSAALHRTLERSEGRRLAAIVVASDGRATKGSDLRAAVEQAAGRQIPIYAVPLGSPVAPVDIEVSSLRAAQTVFIHDEIAVEAQVQARSLPDAAEVLLKLIDTTARPEGETVASETISLAPGDGAISVELRTIPKRAGSVRYRVEAVPLPNERILPNNADNIDVMVTDDRLRLLYVEGYPRYEYRYLKNALLREKSMDLSVLLLEADEQFVQEGTLPIRRFPETPEELNQYDVVLFGDVDPRGGWLTQSQMLMLLDFVANEGGGFAMIAGERSAPQRFVGTPLERLLPVIIDPSAPTRESGLLHAGFRLQLTADGYTSRPFRFAPTLEENRRLVQGLPELYWAARTLGPKPGATVLADHPTISNPRGPGGLPLVVVGQYGAGKIYFQATDDTWRWRRHTGELLHDSYWVQVTRELMRATRVSQDRKYVLRTDRRTYGYGDAVHVQAEVFDAQVLRDHPEAIEAALHELSGLAEGSLTQPPEPRNEQSPPARSLTARFELTRLSPESNLFEGSVVPPKPGGFSVEPADLSWRRPDATGRGSVLIRVERPNLEARQPAADHQSLERAAVATGGRIIDLDRLNEGFSSIRDRSLQVPDDIVEPLWDTKLIFGLFVLMISLEWGLRKAFGLL